MERTILATTFVVIAILIGGCGGGSTSAPPTSEPPPSQPPPSQPPPLPPPPSPPPQSPVVSIEAEPTAFVGDSVTLTANAHDPTGGAVTYVWSQTAGRLVSLSGTTTNSITFVAPEVNAGDTLLFQVEVFSSSGAASTIQSVGVQIYPKGTGGTPTADAGADKYSYVDNPVGYGNLVTLNGHGSTDPEGDQLFFNWVIVSRPSGSAALLSAPYSPITEFRPDRPGRYEIDLVVSDGNSYSAPDRVVVTACRWLEGNFPSGLTINAEDGPYYIASINAPFGSTVVIEAGVDVACNVSSAASGSLTVGGVLDVRGTPEKPVHLSGVEIRVPQPESDSWHFDWRFSHAIFSFLSFDLYHARRGSIQMTDSVVLRASFGELAIPTSVGDQIFERNAFISLRVAFGNESPGRTVFRNNLLVDSRLVLRGNPTSEIVDNTILFPGRTRTCEQFSGNESCEVYNWSEEDVDLRGNYWGDLDLDTIESLISDGKDAPNPFGFPQNGMIFVDPIRTEPAPKTPSAQPYLD